MEFNIIQIILFLVGSWVIVLFFDTLLTILKRSGRAPRRRPASFNHPIIELFTRPNGQRAAAYQEGGLITLRELKPSGKPGKQITRGSYAQVRRASREWMLGK